VVEVVVATSIDFFCALEVERYHTDSHAEERLVWLHPHGAVGDCGEEGLRASAAASMVRCESVFARVCVCVVCAQQAFCIVKVVCKCVDVDVRRVYAVVFAL
jgi:hypothetical protein